ncbi:MAG: hypothetical protein ACK449_05855, partial [Planctomycetota bacterium]
EQPRFPAIHAIDDNNDSGWAVHVDGQDLRTNKSLTLRFDQPIDAHGDTKVIIKQLFGTQHTIGRLRSIRHYRG